MLDRNSQTFYIGTIISSLIIHCAGVSGDTTKGVAL